MPSIFARVLNFVLRRFFNYDEGTSVDGDNIREKLKVEDVEGFVTRLEGDYVHFWEEYNHWDSNGTSENDEEEEKRQNTKQKRNTEIKYLEKLVKDKFGIEIVGGDFGYVEVSSRKTITLELRNQGSETQVLEHYHIVGLSYQMELGPLRIESISLKEQSKKIQEKLPVILEPGMIIKIVAVCTTNYIGKERQVVVFEFSNFKIGKELSVNVIDQRFLGGGLHSLVDEQDNETTMMMEERNLETLRSGVQTEKVEKDSIFARLRMRVESERLKIIMKNGCGVLKPVPVIVDENVLEKMQDDQTVEGSRSEVHLLISALKERINCRDVKIKLRLKCSSNDRAKLFLKAGLHSAKNLALENAVASSILIFDNLLLIHFLGDYIFVHDVPSDCEENEIVRELISIGFDISEVEMLDTYGKMASPFQICFHYGGLDYIFNLEKELEAGKEEYYGICNIRPKVLPDDQNSAKDKLALQKDSDFKIPMGNPETHPTLPTEIPMPLMTEGSATHLVFLHTSGPEEKLFEKIVKRQMEILKRYLNLNPHSGKTMLSRQGLLLQLSNGYDAERLLDEASLKHAQHFIDSEGISIRFSALDIDGHHIQMTFCNDLLQLYEISPELDLADICERFRLLGFKFDQPKGVNYYGMVECQLDFDWFSCFLKSANEIYVANSTFIKIYFSYIDEKLVHRVQFISVMSDDDSDSDDFFEGGLIRMYDYNVILIEADSYVLFMEACGIIEKFFSSYFETLSLSCFNKTQVK